MLGNEYLQSISVLIMTYAYLSIIPCKHQVEPYILIASFVFNFESISLKIRMLLSDDNILKLSAIFCSCNDY